MAFVFPVIGKSEWSGGSWMPSSLNHRGRTHAAIDIYASKGSLIVAPTGSTVIGAGSGNIAGNWIQLRDETGHVYYFAHMAAPAMVSKGDTVKGGQSIGMVGNTGSAKTTSHHLHFSIKKDGKAINPTSMLRNAVVAPDLEQQITGVDSGTDVPPGRWDRPDWAEPVSSEPLPPDAVDDTPAWVDQLASYRKDAAAGKLANPTKVKARHVMQGTLAGMAAMVRRQGFQTASGDGEPATMISREPIRREGVARGDETDTAG